MKFLKRPIKAYVQTGMGVATDWYRSRTQTDEQAKLLELMAMKAELDKLTSDPNKLVNESRNEVARILRVFLREHQITNERLSNDIKSWAFRRTGGNSNSKHANDSGNFIKAITKPKISFERLITAMDILNPLSWSITIGVRWDARPEKKIKFNYVSDVERYVTLTGEQPEKYLTPIRDDEDEDDINVT